MPHESRIVLVRDERIGARHTCHLHKGTRLHMHEHIGVEEEVREELVADARQQPTPAGHGAGREVKCGRVGRAKSGAKAYSNRRNGYQGGV
jgi:hypothetical protein